MVTVIVFLAKERIDESRNEHNERHERGPYVDAIGQIAHDERVVDERTTPKS